ncbi:MAG TPA: hypothetical protein VJ577_11375 [Burkholderiaceae bacterium]|nr:hypothetical protein [Burkholderiaceae bacterium]
MHLGSMGDATSDATALFTQLYETGLHRAPDQAGLDWWVSTSVAAGLTPLQMQEQFIAGAQPEVQWRQADLTNQATPQATDYQRQVWSAADELLRAAQQPRQATTTAPTVARPAYTPVQTMAPATVPTMATQLQPGSVQTTAAAPASDNKMLWIAAGVGGLFLLMRKKA